MFFGITFFVQMLGRLGDLELAASNIVLSIETLSFLPMVGFHIGNTTLVGQAVGRGRPQDGVYSTTSTLHITMAYMMVVATAFIIAPRPLLSLFRAHYHTPSQYAEILDLGVILLRFVAVFCFFDALNLVFSASIKGAGATRFIMWTIAALSIGGQHWAYAAGSESWRSGVFTVLTLCQLAHVLAIRSDRESILSIGLLSNMPLFAAVVLTVLLQLAVVYTPFLQQIFETSALSARELAVCFLLPMVVVIAVELEKFVVRRRDRDGSPKAA